MKKIVIVCRGDTTSRAFKRQLKDLLGHRAEIYDYASERCVPEMLDGDVVMVSSDSVFDIMRPFISDESKVVIARRSINYHEISKLFSIPAGEEVLLVNTTASTTHETIAMLQMLGIDHIHLHPYYPGCREYPRLPLAITPGEAHLAPDCVREVVDISIRVIDITTIIEILTRLDLMDYYADMISSHYVRDIISLIRDNASIMRKGSRLHSQLQGIINTVHDGIVGTDENGLISVFNPVAESILGIPSGAALDKKFSDIKELGFLLKGKSPGDTEIFHTMHGHNFIVNVTDVTYAGGESGNVYLLKDVSEIRRLEESARRKLRNESTLARYTFADFVGTGSKMRACLETARLMARSDATILLEGESGTGKELMAQSIHNASSRCNFPFIAVNFSAITESLLESELFGYDPGAFTGAMKGGRAGLFEAAHKGTIFLDEIGDAPLPFQIKLLRVLQEREIKKLGSFRTIPVDFRVIAATNRNLKELVTRGLFREDLYYRLNVLPLKLPSLRERREDMRSLAEHTYRKLAGKEPKAFFDAVLPAMQAYDWPGNVRELQNAVEFLVHVCPEGNPAPERLPDEIRRSAFSRADSDTSLVFGNIVRLWEKGKRAGRRSLADLTGLPESRVRAALCCLAAEGKICVGRGRRGIIPA